MDLFQRKENKILVVRKTIKMNAKTTSVWSGIRLNQENQKIPSPISLSNRFKKIN